jgi:hypothetical protein
VKAPGRALGDRSQVLRQIYHLASARRTVVQGAGGHGCAEHLLERHGLGAQLDPIRESMAPAPALVLDGKGDPLSRSASPLVELHDVSLAHDSEPLGTEGNGSRHSETGACFDPRGMGTSMQQRSFGRQPVLLPGLFHVNEGALALAKHEVLQAREREIIVVVHGGEPNPQMSLSTSTPLGRASSWTRRL